MSVMQTVNVRKTKSLELKILWSIMWWVEHWKEDALLTEAKCLFVM